MRVVIVGAGLGGLACAISCRKYGIDEVLVLERTAKIEPVSLYHSPLQGRIQTSNTTKHLNHSSNHILALGRSRRSGTPQCDADYEVPWLARGTGEKIRYQCGN